MPRPNLENLLFGGDGKVACETLADEVEEDAGQAGEESDHLPWSASFEAPLVLGVYHPAAYNRNESTKGLTNPKSGRAKRKESERFAAAAGKPPVIGLHAKIQTAGYAVPGSRRPAQVRIFPSKRGGRKPAVPEAEPGSPKVSCFGKVLSERERGRRRREQQRRRGQAKEREARGCWAGLAGIFRRRCARGGGGVQAEEERGKPVAEEVSCRRSSFRPSRSFPAKTELRETEEEQPPAPEPPALGLGGMRRYTSTRRAASWAEEAEMAAGITRRV